MHIKGGFIKNIKKVLFDRGEIILPVEGYHYVPKPNLLEIKLKDTDSVPEVYYRGERLDSMPRGLVDISYHYHTTSDRPDGANDIHIDYYDGEHTMFPDLKSIGHKRMT